MDVLFEILDGGGFVALLWIGILGTILYKSSSKWLVRGKNIDGPILSSQQMLPAHSQRISLDVLNKGELAGFRYSFMINADQRTMLFIALPYNTRLHLIALGDKSGVTDTGLQNKFIEKVSLEGQFPDNFRMYVSRGRQREVRQVFDPTQMAYFIDFCRAYNFELYKDSMFISQAEDARDGDDKTSMIADAEVFLLKTKSLFQRFQNEIT